MVVFKNFSATSLILSAASDNSQRFQETCFAFALTPQQVQQISSSMWDEHHSSDAGYWIGLEKFLTWLSLWDVCWSFFSVLKGTFRGPNVISQFKFSCGFAYQRRAVLKKTTSRPICVWKSTGSHVTCQWGALPLRAPYFCSSPAFHLMTIRI